MAMSIIDKIYAEHQALEHYLTENAQPSFGQAVADDFRKLLALSVASFFEHTLTEAILNFCTVKAAGDPGLVCFVRMKAVERQYSTYFQWDQKTPNSFCSLFGEPLGASMKNDVKNKPELKAACAAFLELGALRNRLVHQNFASFPFEKTAEEVYEEYKSGSKFVDYIVARLGEASERTDPSVS